MKIRNWKWWRLFTKIKPLLQVTRQDEELTQKQEEIRRMKAEMESRTLQVQETEQQLQMVQQERTVVNERLIHLTEALVESDEVCCLIIYSIEFERMIFIYRIYGESKHVKWNLKIWYKKLNNV
jgi:myosin heavy subunit